MLVNHRNFIIEHFNEINMSNERRGRSLKCMGIYFFNYNLFFCKWNMLPNMTPNDHKTIAHYTLCVH